MNTRFAIFVSIGTFFLIPLGCASRYSLVMTPTKDVVEEGGGQSKALASKGYRKIMVIPPTGDPRGAHDELIAKFETEFLKGGLTLVSSVKAADTETDEGTAEAAAGEPDLAEAVKMVQQSGAEAVIKVIAFEWSEEAVPTRFFVLDSTDSPALREVGRQEYQLSRQPKHALNSPEFRFSGKIVDVGSVEIIEAIDIRTAANWNLPSEYSATLELDEDRWVLVDENYEYAAPWWIPEAKKAAERKVLETVTSRITAPPPRTGQD